MTIGPFASNISPTTLITSAEWLNKLGSRRNFLKTILWPQRSGRAIVQYGPDWHFAIVHCNVHVWALEVHLSVQGNAIVYSAAQCAIVHALSCQCKEVHSRAEMPEACSLCWLAEAVTPYFPLSSTNFCNSDVPVQCQWNTCWSNLWQCISFHNCLIDNILPWHFPRFLVYQTLWYYSLWWYF